MQDAGSGDPLLAKYDRLVAKYEAVVAQLRSAGDERNAQAAFALAAMRSPVTGYAFLREGSIIVRNPMFLTLESEHQGTWRTPQGLVPTLSECVLSQSAGLRKPWEVVRLERTDGSCLLDLRMGRVGVGTAALFVATLVDVTEIIQASRALEAAERARAEEQRIRALGEVASGFAHAFNNSLHALKMTLEVVRGGTDGQRLSHRQQRALDAVERIIRDATARVGQIQDAARSRGDAPMGSLELAGIIEDALQLAQAHVVERSYLSRAPIRIDTSIPATLPRVRGLESELRSVFLNLLVNARDAMPGGGTIRITAREGEGSVAVTVSDDGVGIPPEHLGRIFDPFFTTKADSGTGLGLSIARNVMRRLGGNITAENRSGSKGAAFTLTFPIAQVATAEAPARVPSGTTPAASPRRILVVDDDADGGDALTEVLRIRGHEASSVTNGPEAIALFERGGRFDLVLCDLGMPGMNGWDVAERLRALDPSVTAYLVTGWGHEIAPDEPRRRTVAGILAKPLDLDELERAITAKR
ncbi:MAG TPA: ATP-binding protein [Anaeromyxobacteraceae bacterium]|nr:ATP-binding protein [Anaeromyxobacteraceae bacterium]